MHYIKDVEYNSEYKLDVCFEDNNWRSVDLGEHLDGEIFEPLKNIDEFKTAELNADIDTVVWSNGADMSPDFLYEISVPMELSKVAEGREEPGE
jgi:hypothetical protein